MAGPTPHHRNALLAGAGIAAFRRSFTMRFGPVDASVRCEEGVMRINRRAVAAAALAALAIFVSACALRSPDIADVQRNAGHYADRTVTLDGTVTSSWGVSRLPFKVYKVDDGTGEITVLSRGGNRQPVKGSRVTVKGVVRDVAVFNGMPLGLHLEERDLDIRRN
jgi:hypothetical protein